MNTTGHLQALAIYKGEDTLDDGRTVGWVELIDTPDPFYLPIGLIPDGLRQGDIMALSTRFVRRINRCD